MVPYLDFDEMRRVGISVIDINIGCVVVSDVVDLFHAVSLMNMAEYMHLWFQLLHELQQALTPSPVLPYRQIPDAVWGPMCDQDIHVVGNRTP